MNEGIVLVNHEEGDWAALYVDGSLVLEGHSLSDYQILKALDCEFTSHTTVEESPWPQDLSSLSTKSDTEDYDDLD